MRLCKDFLTFNHYISNYLLSIYFIYKREDVDMEIYRTSSRYIGPHHNILGPARFLPYENRGWRAPIFNFGGWGGFHHRPLFGGFGGSMYEQNVIIDNSRHGFWGNLADGLEGFVRGFAGISWMINGMQNMFGMGMPMAQMPMQAQQAQQEQQNTTNTSNLEFNNLKKLGEVSGYKTIVKEADGTYTAYNPKTKDHISGDYETVRDAMLGDDDDTVSETPTEAPTEAPTAEPTPQGSGKDGKTMKAEEFKKFANKDVYVTDELRIKKGESEELVNIKGKTTFGEIDEKSGYPKTITVGGVKYTLVETNYQNEGAVLYQSDSRTKGGEKYRLEWKNDNPVLVQHEDDTEIGAGTVDVHKTRR